MKPKTLNFVIELERNGKYFAMVVKRSSSTNLYHTFDEYNENGMKVIIAHLADSAKQANELANAWNETHKANGELISFYVIGFNEDQIIRLYNQFDFDDDEEIVSAEYDYGRQILTINYLDKDKILGKYVVDDLEENRLDFILNGIKLERNHC